MIDVPHRQTDGRAEPTLIFGLDDPHGLAAAIAACVEGEVGAIELRDFADGEFKIRPLVDPYGRRACVVAGLYADARRSPQDRLCMLIFLVAALRDHGAVSVDVIAPYLPFARKDRRTQPHDPASLRYLAQCLEAAGATSMIALEPHNPAAFDNAFRIRACATPAHRALLDAAIAATGDQALVLASPDPGGIRRAQLWREAIEARTHRRAGFAMLDKRRRADAIDGALTVCGDVRDACVLVIDDLIATGATLARACRAFACSGARRVIVAAAHAQFLDRAADLLDAAGVDALLVSDSLPSARLAGHRLRERLTVVSAAPSLAALLNPRVRPRSTVLA